MAKIGRVPLEEARRELKEALAKVAIIDSRLESLGHSREGLLEEVQRYKSAILAHHKDNMPAPPNGWSWQNLDSGISLVQNSDENVYIELTNGRVWCDDLRGVSRVVLEKLLDAYSQWEKTNSMLEELRKYGSNK